MKCREPERFNTVSLLSSKMFLCTKAVYNICAKIIATEHPPLYLDIWRLEHITSDTIIPFFESVEQERKSVL